MEETVLERHCRRPLLQLQEMSFLRIATTLCNNRELLRLIFMCQLQDDCVQRLFTKRGPIWAGIQSVAKRLLSKISNCPTKFNNRIMELVWTVCYRIMVWRSTYVLSIDSWFLFDFHWTDQGRIDTIKTARFLVKNKNISIRTRFIVACSACLGEEIRELWKEMSSDDRGYFHTENSEDSRPLILFWLHTMEETDDDTKQLWDDACTYALENNMLEAVKYLFSVVPDCERGTTAYMYALKLYDFLKDEHFLEEDMIEMGYFFFFETSKTYRNELSALPTFQLTLLLYFAEREIFMNALEKILPSALLDDITVLLDMMFLNFHFEVTNDDYSTIFVNIWKRIPAWMRRNIANSESAGSYFTSLIRDDFAFILRPAASKKKEKLISLDSKSGTSVSTLRFHKEKWEFLKFLIEEKVITIPSLKKLKDTIIGHGLGFPRTPKAAWKRILAFVQQIASKNWHPDE